MKSAIRASVLVIVSLGAARLGAQPFDGYASFSRTATPYLQATVPTAGQPTGAGTIEFWVRLTDYSASGQDCRSFVGKNSTQAYWVAVCRGGAGLTLRSYFRGAPSLFDAGVLTIGAWTHVAVTTDGTTRRHYINGILAGSNPDSGPPSSSSDPLRIGSDVSWNFPPSADMDELRIWNVARTAAQINSTMHAPITLPMPGLVAVFPLDSDGTDVIANADTVSAAGTVTFGTTNTGTRTLFVPVVLKNQYSSEITFTNRGTTQATVSIQYTATSGGGSGTATPFTLNPYKQRVEADAIDFLRLQGLPIDTSGTRLGTLRVTFAGLSSNDAAAVTVRTATDTTNPVGRAGLSYAGVPVEKTFNGAVYLPALRLTTSTVRTNLALQNAGAAADGSVTLRVTLYNQTGGTFSILPDVALPPGGFKQFSSGDMGLPEGFFGGAKVEVVGGTARFYTYAVQNDQINSDGSFILAVDPATATRSVVTIPSIVEVGTYRTELTIDNVGDTTRSVVATLLCPGCPSNAQAAFLVPAKGQMFFADFISLLRDVNPAIPNPVGVGVVTISEAGGGTDNTQDIVAVARTSSVVEGQGAFGVAYPAVRAAQGAPYVAWISAMQQNATNRSNLAFVNLGDLDGGTIDLLLEIFDGTSLHFLTVDASRLRGIPAGGFVQINAFLSDPLYGAGLGLANAYVKVTRTGGVNGFLAYGVVNDGGNPRERTGDGAYIAMEVPYR